MCPEWKDKDIILGVDFPNRYEGCLKFHKDGTIRLDWGEEWDGATKKYGLKPPSLYPVKRLNAEEVRAAKSLRPVNNDNKRQLWPEPCQAKQLLPTIVQKAPHQQVLEANQGDLQKELMVKSLVPWNCRELRGFLKQANHTFVKDYSAVVRPLTVLMSLCQATLPMTALSRNGPTLFCWSLSGPSL